MNISFMRQLLFFNANSYINMTSFIEFILKFYAIWYIICYIYLKQLQCSTMYRTCYPIIWVPVQLKPVARWRASVCVVVSWRARVNAKRAHTLARASVAYTHVGSRVY